HLRRRPRRVRAPAHAPADGPPREAARDRQRSPLPRLGRVVVRLRGDVPRRRRPDRRVRDARVMLALEELAAGAADGAIDTDVVWHDGSPVAPSPRQVLKAQIDRAAALGFEAKFGSELEFFLFKETYAEAHAKHYRGLTPSVPYILDYHILASTYDEPYLRAV